ncbi:MAG: prolyl oligopeptidase family serine peptidase [Bacteroidetes bacterium]|nr:prolyl oligopeptidase family serine peptidase [Bacteroidota bacterium]
MIKTQITPPVCAKKPHEMEIHGDVRTDNYYWLNDRENEEVIQYLKDENAYTDAVMADTKTFQEDLFKEMKSRIKEDDSSVPYFLNGFWYYTRFETGKEYPVYCRKKDSLESEELILLDVNDIAEGLSYCHVGGLSVSPDNQWLSFGVDRVSRRIYTIHFKNLTTGEILETQIENTTGGATWANDNDTVFFTTRDEKTLRSDRVHRFRRSDQSRQEVFFEADETFNTGVSKTKSKAYLIIVSSSTLTTEYRYLDASNPNGEFKIFQRRIRGMEYGIAHYKNIWYVVTNWDAKNFRLMKCGLENTERGLWIEVVAHREDTLLEGIELFNDFLVLEERCKGLNRITINQLSTGESHIISTDEPAYTLGTGINPEYETTKLRYGYTSMVTPSTTYEYDMVSRERTVLKQQEVVGGYDKSQYASERLMIAVRDGIDVPVSLVYKKDFIKNGNAPLLLYGYGSYGHSIDPTFSSVRLSLLDRGFVFAIAHIRGGEEMGRYWYDEGKLLKKKNTFYDFIDCGKYLVIEKYTSSKHLYAMGGSAGGLLMGAVINMEPKLFNGAIAAVPFVDVVTTMLDESIPLTTGEFDEWGNPKNEEYYHYIKSYSPYDNIEAKEYPNLLVTTGLHDSQVQYWEPAKWVAKLRELKTDNNVLLLQTEMDFGHGGASGRFEQLKEIALEYTFLLMLENRMIQLRF